MFEIREAFVREEGLFWTVVGILGLGLALPPSDAQGMVGRPPEVNLCLGVSSCFEASVAPLGRCHCLGSPLFFPFPPPCSWKIPPSVPLLIVLPDDRPPFRSPSFRLLQAGPTGCIRHFQFHKVSGFTPPVAV